MRKFLICGRPLARPPRPLPRSRPQQDFTVTNHTGHTIVTLNVSPPQRRSLGPGHRARDVLNNWRAERVSRSIATETSAHGHQGDL